MDLNVDEKQSSGSNRKQWMVFFDFDNTITSSDILDNIITRFSQGDRWKAYENAWIEGKIGSRECLEKQLGELRITKKALSEYLSEIVIDPYFGKLLALLREKGIRYMIVSDSFEFLIREILRHNGIRGIKIYANTLSFRSRKISLRFPHSNPDCPRCAHCKRNHVTEHAGMTTVYVGDGQSDICPAQYTNIVFAKAKLQEFFRKNKRPHMAFRDLRDVYSFFEDLEPVPSRAKSTVEKA